jgi:Mg2+-importing ATPase
VIFVIRTPLVPFFRSRPSRLLTVGAIGCVIVGAVLPFSPVAHDLGFRGLPVDFFLVLAVLVAAYLALVEVGKRIFYRSAQPRRPARRRAPNRARRIQRRAARWSHAGR